MIENNELERMWKVVFMTRFKVLFQHLPGGTEETMKKLRIVWIVAQIQTGHLPNIDITA
jgi:hypothetical protein